MQKKQTILVVASLLLVVLSVTLAYFTAQIIGKGKDVSVSSADLKIIFTDSDGAISGSNIEPGWSDTKTFTIENKSNETYKYNIVIKDLVNTFVTNGYLQYKITSTNSGYNMTEFKDVPKSGAPKDKILAYSVSIPVGVTQSYTIEFKYANDESVDQSDDMGKKLSGTLFITEGTERPTLLSQILNDNPIRSERTDFSTPFTTNTVNTLYKAKEDNTDVYYFAGVDGIDAHCEVEGIANDVKLLKFTNGYSTGVSIYDDTEAIDEDTCKTKSLCKLTSSSVLFDVTQAQCQELAENLLMGMYDESMYSEDLTNRTWVTELNKPINNWVKFGKNSSGADLYWRIIRTNSDGSVRLLYHGTSTTTENAYIGTSAFNSSNNNIAYVSYMYGSLGSIPNARTNTNNSAIKKIIDNWYKDNLNTNYGKYLSTTAVYCNDRSTSNNQHFGAYTRLITNKTPSYDCAATEDKFTVDSSTGNGKLTYPIALITADEVSFAGGVYGVEAPMWYYKNSANGSSTGSQLWGLLSPFVWNGWSSRMFDVNGSSQPGYLSVGEAGDTEAVRPVLSLKSCIKYSTGDGSAENPYTILETESGC